MAQTLVCPVCSCPTTAANNRHAPARCEKCLSQFWPEDAAKAKSSVVRAAVGITCAVLIGIFTAVAVVRSGAADAPGDAPIATVAAPNVVEPALQPVDAAVAAQPAAQPVIVAAPVRDDPPAPGEKDAGAAVPAEGGEKSKLKYAWIDGQEYRYEFTAEANVGKSILEVSGFTTYKPGEIVPAEASPPEEESGTGTGFVVHADGYLLTCAHVIEGATSINVHLGDRDYPGEVVSVDKEHDLALVRIVATGLQSLELADSDRVELGQEVRVVGYPLTSVLGNSLKVTRGTLAGLIAQGATRLLQVDASINPGNSGGPLVNDRGEVVGITSSKLAGESISNVGFAVAVNDAVRLLEAAQVGYQTAAQRERMDGPSLARHVAPAVALLTCISKTEQAVQRKVTFAGQFDSHRRSAPDAPTVAASPSRYDAGEQIVSDRGELISNNSREQLPLFLGSLGQIGLEPLPPAGSDSCETLDVISVRYKSLLDEEDQLPAAGRDPFADEFGYLNRPPLMPIHVMPGPRPFFSRPFTRPGWGAAPEEKPDESAETTEHAATLQTTISVVKSTADVAILKKVSQLKTVHPAGTTPLAHLLLESDIAFDLKQGTAKEAVCSGTLTLTEDGKSTEVPIKLSYILVEPDHAVAAAAVAQPQTDTVPQAEPIKKLSSDDVQRLVGDLGSGDYGRRHLAVHALLHSEVVAEQRSNVGTALVQLTSSSDPFLRKGAIQALGVWGSPDEAAELIALLEHRDLFTRQEAIKTLARCGGAAGADALAELVVKDRDRTAALEALRTMGAPAAAAVQRLAKHEDQAVRALAEELLAAPAASTGAD